jgi:rhodanese-related sulfurtransferase
MNLIKNTIDCDELQNKLFCATAPVLIDVRRVEIFASANTLIPSANWQDHQQAAIWGSEIEDDQEIVIYCAHGHQLSLVTVSILRNMGKNAVSLAGGIEAWELKNAPTICKKTWSDHYSKSWMSNENPKAASLACAWFIKRFVNPTSTIHYLDSIWVADGSIETDSLLFDVNKSDITFCQNDGNSSLGAFISQFSIQDPALLSLASIVRAVDNKSFDSVPQSAGLVAVIDGLSNIYTDDLTLLAQALTIYDALYKWCSTAAKIEVI